MKKTVLSTNSGYMNKNCTIQYLYQYWGYCWKILASKFLSNSGYNDEIL